MICPKCNNNLAMSDTHGVEIDYCPNCRGVWLDRGELEKIIERSYVSNSQYMGNAEHDDHHDQHFKKHTDEHQSYGHQSKRRKGFLSDLFDF